MSGEQQYAPEVETNPGSAERPLGNANEQREAEAEPVEQGKTVRVQPAEFSSLTAQGGEKVADSRNVRMLMDVELNVTVELGSKHMKISEILNLGKGSVVELARASGEPLDIFVNGTRIARGEVVVIDEQFAVRITDLASPEERISSLK